MKNLVLILAVSAVVSLVVFNLVRPEPTIMPPIPEPPVGAVSTLDGVDMPFVSIGGLRQFWWRQPIAATSSVICSVRIAATSTLESFAMKVLKNPMRSEVNGTNLRFDVSTSSSQYSDGNNPSTYGSSSPAFILNHALTTGKQANVVWAGAAATSSDALGIGDRLITQTTTGLKGSSGATSLLWIIKPGEYFNVRVATSTPEPVGAGPMTGTCSAIFTEL